MAFRSRVAILTLILLRSANAQATPVRHLQGVYAFFLVALLANAQQNANPSILNYKFVEYIYIYMDLVCFVSPESSI